MPTPTPLSLRELETYGSIDPFFELNTATGDIYSCHVNDYGTIVRSFGYVAMPTLTMSQLLVEHAESPLHPSHLFFAYRSDAALHYETCVATTIEPNDLVFINGIDENNRPEYVGQFGIVATVNGPDAMVILNAPVGAEGMGGRVFETRVLTRISPTTAFVIDEGIYTFRNTSARATHDSGGA